MVLTLPDLIQMGQSSSLCRPDPQHPPRIRLACISGCVDHLFLDPNRIDSSIYCSHRPLLAEALGSPHRTMDFSRLAFL